MEHILKQTIGLENIEIILVDDASTDGGATLSLMMEYEKRYPDNIMVIPLEQNLRQGGARNVGVMYAGGEYLMFCDADDWIVLDAMEILYRIASKYDADVVEFRNIDVDEIEDKAVKAAGSDKYIRDMDKIKYDVWEFKEDDESRREYMMFCSGYRTLGCWNKLYRLSMIQDNNIRFAEHLICEEPSFTLPVRLYERKHVLIDTELHYCFQSPNSTVRSSWHDKKFDNIKVWLTIVQDFEKRGLLEKYHNELEYMFFGWGFGLSIKMLVARGYTLSVEELKFLKGALLRLFPNVRRNVYVVGETDGWDMLMQSLLEMELTEENVPEFNRVMQLYLQKWAESLSKV